MRAYAILPISHELTTNDGLFQTVTLSLYDATT